MSENNIKTLESFSVKKLLTLACLMLFLLPHFIVTGHPVLAFISFITIIALTTKSFNCPECNEICFVGVGVPKSKCLKCTKEIKIEWNNSSNFLQNNKIGKFLLFLFSADSLKQKKKFIISWGIIGCFILINSIAHIATEESGTLNNKERLQSINNFQNELNKITKRCDIAYNKTVKYMESGNVLESYSMADKAYWTCSESSNEVQNIPINSSLPAKTKEELKKAKEFISNAYTYKKWCLNDIKGYIDDPNKIKHLHNLKENGNAAQQYILKGAILITKLRMDEEEQLKNNSKSDTQ